MSGKHPMKIVSYLFVFFMGIIHGIKQTKVMVNSVNFYVDLPFLRLFMPRYSFFARFICNRFFNIFHVLRMIGFPQVANSIIKTYSVYVIYFFFRPRIMGNCPSNSVRPQKNIIYTDYYVVTFVFACNNTTSRAFPPFNPPANIAGIWVVTKKLIDSFYGWVFHSSNMATFKALVKEF